MKKKNQYKPQYVKMEKADNHSIVVADHMFFLQTRQTSYCFQVLPSGQLEHLYYGEKIQLSDVIELQKAISPKVTVLDGNLITYSDTYPQVGLENRCLEVSTMGKGDIKEPFVELIYSDGSTSCDFLYEEYRIEAKQALETLPSAYDSNNETYTLVVTLVDKKHQVQLELFYTVFVDTDVIVRSSKLRNCSEKKITVERLLSAQIDWDESPYIFTTFTGAWTREMNRQDTRCTAGITVNDSKAGTSSSRHNPFIMLSKEDATEEYGECYACNLIYSGNHYEAVEVNGFHQTHFQAGISPHGFHYQLQPGNTLEAPEAVLTYSKKGFTGVSRQMHQFVRRHIVRGEWQYKDRPVLLNNWEATYFNFNERKLMKLAKAASNVGVELFVLDDGWFGERNDDTSSLGDWFPNLKKLPNGLYGLCEKINELGMDFGIWVEPEMISRNSECYRKHPEFAVEIPNQPQSLGRNQLLMDLTQPQVQDYLINQLSLVFGSANISYVKWDMNRIMSDTFSGCLSQDQQGEFIHRYILGLYHVLKVLTERFPEILFESCASGGNRADLGMLCYMPQMWASDNTDAICRAEIQYGYSYGYPMSTIGAHVSSCPNHQTLRNTSLDTRFQVATFGLLGYELDLTALSKEELTCIKEQINWYKTYRTTLQFGHFYRLKKTTQGEYQWITVSNNRKEAIGMYLQTKNYPNLTQAKFKTRGLHPQVLYKFTNREMIFDIREFGDLINAISPIHIKNNGVLHQIIAKVKKLQSEKEEYWVNGSVLNQVGIRLHQGFGGCGYNDEIRYFPDYASRIYIMEEETTTQEN